MGLESWSGENVRFKFGVISKPIPELEWAPSMTVVNGPFGDFVQHLGYLYFSW